MFPLNSYMNATNHAIVQTLVRPTVIFCVKGIVYHKKTKIWSSLTDPHVISNSHDCVSLFTDIDTDFLSIQINEIQNRIKLIGYSL